MDGGEEEAQLAVEGVVVGDGRRRGDDGVHWGEEGGGWRSLLRRDGVTAFRPAHMEHREPVQDHRYSLSVMLLYTVNTLA